ncbi:MAG: hypothetical protein HOB26_01500 [Flavobacteriales bacterium]|nr:hypothetical protein [Flavobacteriales bacterium]
MVQIFSVFTDVDFELIQSQSALQLSIDWINEIVFVGATLAVILVFVTTILIGVLVNSCDITIRKSFLVSFAFLLLALGVGEHFFVSIQSISNLLLVIMLLRLFRLPNSSGSKSIIFDSSGLIGTMSILDSGNVFLMIIVWVGIVSFKSVTLNDWIISLCGFFLPFLYLIAGLYFFDSFQEVNNWLPTFSIIKIQDSKYIVLLGMALLFIPALLVFIGNYAQKASVIRKMLGIVLLLFVILTVKMIFSGGELSITTILIPTSIVVGLFFDQIKKVIIAESLVLLFLAVSSYYYFVAYFS